MLNTVINFLFKNFIALWRHLAKTPLLSFIHTVQIDLSIVRPIVTKELTLAYCSDPGCTLWDELAQRITFVE